MFTNICSAPLDTWDPYEGRPQYDHLPQTHRFCSDIATIGGAAECALAGIGGGKIFGFGVVSLTLIFV